MPGLELPWPADLVRPWKPAGFRHEVRQLFDRIIESGRTAQPTLRSWAAAAAGRTGSPPRRSIREYRDVLDLRMPEAFDPAGIITAARQIFQDAPEFLAAERERLQLVLVDDIQEANPAVFELLADIAAGKDCYVTSSPDTVVQGFRGARPDLVAELPRLLSHRQPPSWNGPCGTPTGMHRPLRRRGSVLPAGFRSVPAVSWPGGWSSCRQYGRQAVPRNRGDR